MQMRPTLLRAFLMMVLLSSLALSGCSPAAPTLAPTATMDAGLLQTQVAQAIAATQTAAPTFTPLPTYTPLPTFTPLPLPTKTPLPTATVGTPEPTATKQIAGDAAKFTGTAPHSGAEVRPNEFYNLEFDFLNVGTTTWGPGYVLVLVGGERFTNVTQIPLTQQVPPGKKGVFILGTFGSEDMSKHYTRWQLFNPQGLPVPGGIGDFWYQPV